MVSKGTDQGKSKVSEGFAGSGLVFGVHGVQKSKATFQKLVHKHYS